MHLLIAALIAVVTTAMPSPTHALPDDFRPDDLAVFDLPVAKPRMPPPPTAPPLRMPPTGLWELPFAPPGLSDCDEMMFYAAQWGLPDWFRTVGWRESNCRNEADVRTSCCHGYFQMWVSLHLEDRRMRPAYEACGVATHHDLNSDIPIEKQRQACVASALYSVVGKSAWSQTAP